MTALFSRQCVLFVGSPPTDSLKTEPANALRIEGLRVQFKIEKSDKPEPNTGEILVYNLSKTSRAALDVKGLRVLLLAGYVGTTAQIFSGNVRLGSHEKRGVDFVTKLQLGDGERAYQLARVSKSFPPGTSFADVVDGVVQTMGIDPGNAVIQAAKVAGGKAFNRGYTAHAQSATELTRLLDGEGLTWSIQDSRIQVAAESEALGDQVPLISPDTGLIGTPAFGTPEKKGGRAFLKLRTLLQPGLRPRSRFKLESAVHRGFVLVKKLTHQGDTDGGDWYTDLEGVPLA